MNLLHCWQNRCRCPATTTAAAFEWNSHTLWRRWYRFASVKSAAHFSAWQRGGDAPPPEPAVDPLFPVRGAPAALFLSFSAKLIISPPPSSSSKYSSSISSSMKVRFPSTKLLVSIVEGWKVTRRRRWWWWWCRMVEQRGGTWGNEGEESVRKRWKRWRRTTSSIFLNVSVCSCKRVWSRICYDLLLVERFEPNMFSGGWS